MTKATIDNILAKPVSQTKDGIPVFDRKTFQTAVQALRIAGRRLRWNEVKRKPEVCSAEDFDKNGNDAEWSEMDDHLDNVIRADIAHTCLYQAQRGKPKPLTFTMREWDEAVHKYADLHPANPPQSTLMRYADQAKDMTDDEAEIILEEVLRDALGVDMTKNLNKWAAKALWVGVLQRVFEPGGVQRIIPVLIGEQDCGKSAFFRAMLPPELADYYQPNVNLFGEDSEFVHSTMGMILGECPELAGAGKADARKFKARIGIGVDNVRLKYGRHAARTERTMYLVGTANLEQALPRDQTGTTRFVTVDCPGPRENVIGAHRTVVLRRDQCWKAAARLYFLAKNKFDPAFLPKALRSEQQEANKEHVPVNDAIAVQVAEYVKNAMSGEVSVKQVAISSGLFDEGQKIDNMTAAEIKMALKQAGCKEVRRKIGEATVRLWKPPEPKGNVIKTTRWGNPDSEADRSET